MREGSGFEDVQAWGLDSSASTSSFAPFWGLTKLSVQADDGKMRSHLLCPAGEQNQNSFSN
jgi:hypothetical protein